MDAETNFTNFLQIYVASVDKTQASYDKYIKSLEAIIESQKHRIDLLENLDVLQQAQLRTANIRTVEMHLYE